MELHSHTDKSCKGLIHVYVEETFGGVPFCKRGQRRNPAYRRTLWQKLFGQPKS